MSAPAAESHTLTGVGLPHSYSSRDHVSMPPEYLPVEIWHLIIMCLDDYCFAWFVLRQTCPFLNLVTEQVFARYVSRTCTVRFAGQTLGSLLAHDLQADTGDCRQDPASRQALVRHHASPASYWANFSRAQPPSFRFQPSSFVPATTKAKLLLKLCDAPTLHETLPVYLPHAGTIDTTTHLIQVFFQPGAEADAERSRLLNQAHFVLFHGQLRSMRLPSATFNVADHQLLLDWRRLCDTFMRDQFKCRYESQNSVTWWRNFD
ncbi:hypothetical protein GMOD_00001114 [Pyrenophora seminiperda CCB06]|uniref:Uncharacterized protein n=1 Tax=Pyrenophora seminiperda CCB06 TaxID=1302712 RepID=A0A3M7LYB3_9PLEO|nr:hypothetical protein GMOD_00001114 [Pyrenophora seminiperda CCB06]